MRPIIRLLHVAVLANTILCSNGLGDDPPQMWGKLKAGPHAVGFRSVWQFDYSRTYNTVFDDKTTYASGKAPRPILINIWYPAKKPDDLKPMPHRGYLAIQTDDPRLSKFAAALTTYERAVVTKELMGKSTAALPVRERALMDQFWGTPTASYRDIPAAPGKFPLVIYHSGFGSSFEDNAILCEFLASHGYVVLGSAFQKPSGASYNVDGRKGSARDMEFLITYASRLPDVDWNHIGVMGHSGGAQAALIFHAQAASPVDAVVSLDTTQDYHSLADHKWGDLVKPLVENKNDLSKPLLMVANAPAIFELIDSLKSAERYYLTFSDLDHNDFISQGIMRRDLESLANPDDRDLRNQRDAARAAYSAICECIVDFCDVYLKENMKGKSNLIEKFKQNKLGGTGPHLDFVPVGITAPEPYQDESGAPPAPRQVRPFMAERGLEATVALLNHYHEKDPSAPIFQGDFGFALVFELLEKRQTQEALAFHRLFRSFGENFSKSFIAWGKEYERIGRKPLALDYFEKAHTLDPGNTEAAERLKTLREPKKD